MILTESLGLDMIKQAVARVWSTEVEYFRHNSLANRKGPKCQEGESLKFIQFWRDETFLPVLLNLDPALSFVIHRSATRITSGSSFNWLSRNRYRGLKLQSLSGRKSSKCKVYMSID